MDFSFENLDETASIIVGTLHHGKVQWFISEKELWFLDLKKLEKAFADPGFADEVEESSEGFRTGIPILDGSTFPEFVERTDSIQFGYPLLKAELGKHLPLGNWEENGYFFPRLWVDFDQSFLLSMFPEGTPFEDFLPEGWRGAFQDFYHLVPAESKYWVIDGTDHWECILGRQHP